jgi:hypothetical protein
MMDGGRIVAQPRDEEAAGQRRARVEGAGFFVALTKLDVPVFGQRAFLAGEDHVVDVVYLDTTVRNTVMLIRTFEMHAWTFGEQCLVRRFRHVLDTRQHSLAYHGD